MSPRGESIIAGLRTICAVLDEHAVLEPAEAAAIANAVVTHVRSAHPAALSLDALGAPQPRDPRPGTATPADALRAAQRKLERLP